MTIMPMPRHDWATPPRLITFICFTITNQKLWTLIYDSDTPCNGSSPNEMSVAVIAALPKPVLHLCIWQTEKKCVDLVSVYFFVNTTKDSAAKVRTTLILDHREEADLGSICDHCFKTTHPYWCWCSDKVHGERVKYVTIFTITSFSKWRQRGHIVMAACFFLYSFSNTNHRPVNWQTELSSALVSLCVPFVLAELTSCHFTVRFGLVRGNIYKSLKCWENQKTFNNFFLFFYSRSCQKPWVHLFSQTYFKKAA